MYNNAITSIPDKSFANLTQLGVLFASYFLSCLLLSPRYLHANLVTSINNGAFAELSQLQILFVDNLNSRKILPWMLLCSNTDVDRTLDSNPLMSMASNAFSPDFKGTFRFVPIIIT
jgi:hypothetical protein